MDGQNWRGLNGLHLSKVEKRRADFFCKYISVHIKLSFKQLENHSHFLCGRGFANGRLFHCQFDV